MSDTITCEPCKHSRLHGWWGPSIKGSTHCGGPTGCHRTWKSRAEVHCWTCHFHFSSHNAANLAHPHDSHGTLLHLDPATVKNKAGKLMLSLTQRPPGDVWGGLAPSIGQSADPLSAPGTSEAPAVTP